MRTKKKLNIAINFCLAEFEIKGKTKKKLPEVNASDREMKDEEKKDNQLCNSSLKFTFCMNSILINN